MKFIIKEEVDIERTNTLLNQISRVANSGGSVLQKIQALIKIRRDNHGNKVVQDRCNKILTKLYDLRYDKKKEVVGKGELDLDEALGLKEGISDNMTVEEIAEKHKVPVKDIRKQLEIGVKVEKEHTDDESKAERIALDHLFEIPNYYDKLDKMERDALKEDTIKQNGKWVNKGKEGTHGTFRTKKEADTQRKAMFARVGKKRNFGESFDNKTTLDLTIFDDNKIFEKKFNTIEELDNYIREISGLDLKADSNSDTDFNKSFIGRNYRGDYHYFNSKNGDKVGDVETYALLRTDIEKYPDGYGVSYYDFGYISPYGWKRVDDRNIEIIDSSKSYKGHWRNKELKEDIYYRDKTPIEIGDYIIFNTLDDELSEWKENHPSKKGYKVVGVDREEDGTPTGMYFIENCPYAVDYNEDDVEKIDIKQFKEYYDPTEVITDYFSKDEQENYGIDEEGWIEDGLERYIHCGWCEEPTPLSDMRKELNLGYICKDCQDALYSRGEKAVYEESLKESTKTNSDKAYGRIIVLLDGDFAFFFDKEAEKLSDILTVHEGDFKGINSQIPKGRHKYTTIPAYKLDEYKDRVEIIEEPYLKNEKLIQGKSDATLKKNIATEIKAGKDPKQAYAIAKSIQDKHKNEKLKVEQVDNSEELPPKPLYLGDESDYESLEEDTLSNKDVEKEISSGDEESIFSEEDLRIDEEDLALLKHMGNL